MKDIPIHIQATNKNKKMKEDPCDTLALILLYSCFCTYPMGRADPWLISSYSEDRALYFCTCSSYPWQGKFVFVLHSCDVPSQARKGRSFSVSHSYNSRSHSKFGKGRSWERKMIVTCLNKQLRVLVIFFLHLPPDLEKGGIAHTKWEFGAFIKP